MTSVSSQMVTTYLISDPDERKAAKKLERANAAKVLRLFAKLVTNMGFNRRSTFFFREAGELIQFLHLHKYTFGPYFRMHVCVRVLNDPTSVCVLAGTDDVQLANDRVDFVYGSDLVSLQACAEAMARFVADFAEPWFVSWPSEALLSDISFLRSYVRAALAEHVAGMPDEENVRISRALFYKK